jgi:hypothetical protein
MKLNKFQLDKMTVKEMSTIKAGSGTSSCLSTGSSCTGNDRCNANGDACGPS